LKTSKVVDERATAASYSDIGMCQHQRQEMGAFGWPSVQGVISERWLKHGGTEWLLG
jgi:hypothetical protein